MIDDMARLKQALEQMDAEDPTVAQAAKDRAAQTLSDAKLNFSKMAELIEQRRLLLRPRIVAGIKRMDQPGMLGDAAFRDTGSALRKEGQSFRQIAEAIELTGRPAPPYEDPVQTSEPLRQMERLLGLREAPSGATVIAPSVTPVGGTRETDCALCSPAPKIVSVVGPVPIVNAFGATALR